MSISSRFPSILYPIPLIDTISQFLSSLFTSFISFCMVFVEHPISCDSARLLTGSTEFNNIFIMLNALVFIVYFTFWLYLKYHSI